MENVSLSITDTRGIKGILLYIPRTYASFLGKYVRPEGILKTGLVLHCNAPEARGQSYAVQDNHPENPHARMVVNLPEQFIGTKLLGVKAQRYVGCAGEQVDGHSVVTIERFDPQTMIDRTARRKAQTTALVNFDPPASTLDAVRQAILVLRRVARTPEVANAIISLAENLHRTNVKLAFNGTELTAKIEQDLFGHNG